MNIPGNTGTGLFVVATSNAGVSGTITVTADTGGATVPATITVCETDPHTSAWRCERSSQGPSAMPASARNGRVGPRFEHDVGTPSRQPS